MKIVLNTFSGPQNKFKFKTENSIIYKFLFIVKITKFLVQLQLLFSKVMLCSVYNCIGKLDQPD